MKQFSRCFLSIALLLSSFAMLANSSNCGSSADSFNCDGTNIPIPTHCGSGCSASFSTTESINSHAFEKPAGYLNLRSTGANTARELVGWQWVIHGGQGRLGESFGAATLAYEYQRSFWNHNLARALFGSDRIALQGSRITGVDRNPYALIADLVGLPDDFDQRVTLKPQIQNHTIDFNAFYAFGDCDSCWNGAYLRMHTPLTIGKWSMEICGGTSVSSDTFYPNCKFGSEEYAPVLTANDALYGQATLPSDSNRKLLQAGYFSPCDKYKVRLADIDLIAGYNMIWEEAKHLGAYLQLVLPTGNKPNGRVLFQTVIGNRQHVEFGGGISGHAVLWDNQCDQSLSAHLEGNVTHMFSNHQERLLDFAANGTFSRYALLREFYDDGVTPTGNLFSATSTNYQDVKVGVSVKGDLSFKLAYRYCGFGLDLGYNIYGHSHESLSLRKCSKDGDRIGNFGIAGITDTCATLYTAAGVDTSSTLSCIGFTGAPTVVSTGQPINATYSTAPNVAKTPVNNWDADNWTWRPVDRPDIDFALLQGAPDVTTNTSGNINATVPGTCPSSLSNVTANMVAPFSQELVGSSYVAAPKLIKKSDLCPNSAAAPAVLTQKVFLFSNYQWADEREYNPHIGVGGEAEFSGSRFGSRPSLSQWGVMIKGGLSF